MNDELMHAVGKYALAKGEAWRIGEGCEIMDTYQSAQDSAAGQEQAGAVADPEDNEWHPTNRYLFRYLCKRIGIELGKDNIATAISKVSVAIAAPGAAIAARLVDVMKDLDHICNHGDDGSRLIARHARATLQGAPTASPASREEAPGASAEEPKP